MKWWWSKEEELDIVKQAIKEEEERPRTYFFFGISNNNRVTFNTPYREVSMSKSGCQDLIDQITFYMNQLEDEKPTEQ